MRCKIIKDYRDTVLNVKTTYFVPYKIRMRETHLKKYMLSGWREDVIKKKGDVIYTKKKETSFIRIRETIVVDTTVGCKRQQQNPACIQA